MGKEELRYEDLLEIVRLFESSSELSELHLKYGTTELDLRKQGAETAGFGPSSAPVAMSTPAPSPTPKAAEAPAARVSEAPPAPSKPTPSSGFAVKSPTVGTFYAAPEPGAAPFVSVGQRVASDATVCIVEVMKVMNAISAGCSGTVSQILVQDREAVEFGQTLIVIEQD